MYTVHKSDNLRELILRAIDYAIEHKTFDLRNIVDASEDVVVFGLGRYFEEAFERQKVKERFHVRWLCDNNPEKWGKTFHGLKCLAPDQLGIMAREGKKPVVIIMLGDGREVYTQMSQLVGVENVIYYDNIALAEIVDEPRDAESFASSRGRILEAFQLLDEEQSRKVFANVFCQRVAPSMAQYSYNELLSRDVCVYFDPSVYTLGEEESFVDCGDFTGDTIDIFLRLANKKFRHIDAFELSRETFDILKRNIATYESEVSARISCHHAGVADRAGTISYSEDSSADGFSIFNNGTQKKTEGRLVRLDDALAGSEVSLLKMDIEGAEMAALRGARNLLESSHPKVAICVYHRTSDMWNVPLLLHEISSNYRIFFRQHSDRGHWDTLC